MLEDLKKFTYDVYIDFLKLLRSKYRIVTFSEASEANCPYVIMRHDVDASLDAALTMAKIETGLNIRSTYFVLFSHKLYNLLETDSLRTLREISELGHEIGLHYDLEAYEGYHRDLKETLEDEARLLEKLLNKRVVSIACHNPSTLKSGDPFKNIPKYINAYNPSLYDLYVSDSCRAWTMEDLRRLLKFDYKRAQLLVHPVFWTEVRCNRDAVLERLFQLVEKKNHDYKYKWLELWHKNPRVKQYDACEREAGN